MGGVCSADGGEERRVQVLVRKPDNWRDPGVARRIILGWMFRKYDVRVWTGLNWFRIETGGENL
jgi:hypothetical protein